MEKIKLILYGTFLYIVIIPLYFICFLLKYLLTIIDIFFEILLNIKICKSISEFKEKYTSYNKLFRNCIEFINTKEL